MLERDTLLARLNGLDQEMEKIRAAGVDDTNVDRLTHLVTEVRSVEASLDRIERASAIDQASRADAAAAQVAAGRGETRSLAEFIVDGDNRNQLTRGATLQYNGDIFTGANYGQPDAVEGVVPQYDPNILRRLRGNIALLDLVPFGSTESDTYIYYQQTGYTKAAAPLKRRTSVNDDYPKPNKSTLEIVKKTAHVTKTAVWTRTDLDTLADLGQVEALIRDELVYDVRTEIERQLFADTQVEDGLPSLVEKAQTTSFAAGANPNDRALNFILAVRHAKTMARLAHLPVDFLATDPVQIEAIETYQTNAGVFLAGGPWAGGTGSLWGLTLVDSDALTGREKSLVGSLKGFRGFTRKQLEITVGTNNDDFLRDAVALKASTRLLGAVVRPEAFVAITEGAAPEAP